MFSHFTFLPIEFIVEKDKNMALRVVLQKALLDATAIVSEVF